MTFRILIAAVTAVLLFAGPATAQGDRETLEAIYTKLGSPQWIRLADQSDNWNTDRPLDEWYGVETNADGRVVALIFERAQRFTGEIPRELGNLSQLQRLHLALSRSNLTGGIPREIGNLSQLEELSLYNGNLTGEIPREISNLSQLQTLVLRNNNLTGEIPRELGSLSQLVWFYLDENNLTGEIPRELGNLSQLKGFTLSNNNLTGEIPRELGNMSSQIQTLPVKLFRLYGNRLTGEIPYELAGFEDTINPQQGGVNLPVEGTGDGNGESDSPDRAALEALYTSMGGSGWTRSDNWNTDRPLSEWYGVTVSPTGAAPVRAVDADGRVVSLELGGNNLTGEIPREIGNLSQLQTLVLRNNNLTGEIPREIARFESTINPQQGGVNLPVQLTPVPALPALALLILGGGLGVIGLWRTRRAARGPGS